MPVMHPVRTLTATVVAVVLLGITSGCSSSGSDRAGNGSTSGGTEIAITITGDSIEPNGARVEASVGAPITLKITADRAGELHVHSTPEQEIAFEAGTTTKELTIDTPGIVEVEDHDLEKVVVQIEVK